MDRTKIDFGEFTEKNNKKKLNKKSLLHFFKFIFSVFNYGSDNERTNSNFHWKSYLLNFINLQNAFLIYSSEDTENFEMLNFLIKLVSSNFYIYSVIKRPVACKTKILK